MEGMRTWGCGCRLGGLYPGGYELQLVAARATRSLQVDKPNRTKLILLGGYRMISSAQPRSRARGDESERL